MTVFETAIAVVIVFAVLLVSTALMDDFDE
jgi:hypothetical protein